MEEPLSQKDKLIRIQHMKHLTTVGQMIVMHTALRMACEWLEVETDQNAQELEEMLLKAATREVGEPHISDS